MTMRTIACVALVLWAVRPADAQQVAVHMQLAAPGELRTEETKTAEYIRDYLKRWAKSEIRWVDDAAAAALDVSVVSVAPAEGTARTTSLFGVLTTTHDEGETVTLRVCATADPPQCTLLMASGSGAAPSVAGKLKKFVKDNRAALAEPR